MLRLMRLQADAVEALASLSPTTPTHLDTMDELTGRLRRQAVMMGADPGADDQLVLLLSGASLVAMTERLTLTSAYVGRLQRWAGATPATLAAMALVGVGDPYRPDDGGR